MLSRYDIEHVEEIMKGDGDWFTAKLLRLIADSDLPNRERIRAGFPKEVALYEAWFYKNERHPYPEAEW
jgi:hypothetical protein